MNVSLRSHLRFFPFLFGLAALLVLSGCANQAGFSDPLHKGPFYAPKNFSAAQNLPATLRRVVLLPAYAGEVASPETAAALDHALFGALQKQARFEVVPLSREDSLRWFGAAEFSSVSALPHDYIAQIAAKFAADAVVFVDLTAFKPYRPLAVGFHAKLATVSDIRLIWTFDETISAEDPAVANRARHNYLHTDRGDQPIDLSHSVLQSPGRFAEFAAEAMFETLPAR